MIICCFLALHGRHASSPSRFRHFFRYAASYADDDAAMLIAADCRCHAAAAATLLTPIRCRFSPLITLPPLMAILMPFCSLYCLMPIADAAIISPLRRRRHTSAIYASG